MAEQTACVTGASSGIGLHLATVFARHGHPVVLLARTTDKLEQLAEELRSRFGVRADVIAADLRQPSAPAHIAEELRKRDLTVDILVNNAGFGRRGPFAELDLQQQLDMIQVNIAAAAHLTRLLLPGMIQRNVGGVMNVASTAAFQAGPHMAIYYATKAFLLSFTEALHEEVAGTDLRITCLCPGPTDTGFAATARMEDGRLFRSGIQSAELVARVGYAAFQRNRAIAIPGFRNAMRAFATRLATRSAARRFAMALNG
jgi:short-subunit dehydrogenase